MKDFIPHTSLIGRVHDDIVSSLLELRSSFNHVYREANFAAHNLARYALSSILNVTWVGESPPLIRSFILFKMD